MMAKWRVLLTVIASLVLLHFQGSFSVEAASAAQVTINNTNNAPLSYTVQTSAEGTPVWVTIVPRGHNISPQVLNTQPWWTWGNTLTDTYLFAVGHPSDVEMILQFQEESNGVPKSRLYGDVSGHKQIQYTWEKNNIKGNTPSEYSLKILSLNGVQTIDMAPTKGGNWVVHGHPNYDLQIHSDLNQANVPARDELVGSGGTDAPEWQTSQVDKDPHPDWSYDRFKGFERIPDAPPFKVETPFMPSFPYVGIHYGQPDWYTSNPNPFYFDTKTFKFTEEPIVGFQEGGIYQLNSVSSAPNLNFESPFAFYNFYPKTRYAQLVIRAQNYNAYDPYFYYPTPKNLQSYRYSWSMGTNGEWDYGLTLGGFRDFPGTIHIGNNNVEGVAPAQLPQWTVNHPWDTITLDQAMNGYPGSEGIYFYSVQSPDMWQWMLGYLNQPPEYLAHPKLPNKVELDTQSTISVPLGFRDEYSSAYFHTPLLYASPIDHLMHLQWAEGGVYHFSKTEILRTNNVDNGKYINSWTRETIPFGTVPAKVLEQVANLDGYLLYTGTHGVVIRYANVSPTLMTIQPPTDKTSWNAYVSKVKPFQQGGDPSDLYNWILPFRGPTEEFSDAAIQNLKADENGFSFELTVTRGHPTLSEIDGLPSQPGKYMVTYHPESHQWSNSLAQGPHLTGNVTLIGTAQVGQLSNCILTIQNKGNVPWTGAVTAFAGKTVMFDRQITIEGGQTWQQKLGWTPEGFGSYQVGMSVDKYPLFERTLLVSNNTRLRYDFLFHPGPWINVVNAMLLILLLGLALGAMGLLRRSSRKEDLS